MIRLNFLNKFKQKDGVILITVLGVTVIISIMILALLQNCLVNLHFAGKQVKGILALNAAEAGIATAMYCLEENNNLNGYSAIQGNLQGGSNPLDYKVDIINNFGSPTADTGSNVPPFAIKIISTGYINKGTVTEINKTIESIFRARSLEMSIATSGPIDLNDAGFVKVEAEPGYSGNVHSNFDPPYPAESMSADMINITISFWFFSFSINMPPMYDISGRVTTPGAIDPFIKLGIKPQGNYQEGDDPANPVAPVTIPNWNYTDLKNGHYDPNSAYIISPGLYKVESGQFNRYNITTGNFEMTMPWLPAGVSCSGNTLTVDTGHPLQIYVQGNLKVENSNFHSNDIIEVITEKVSGNGGNMTATNTNFFGNASLIVEGKLTFEGYSNISGSPTDGLALFAGEGMDVTMTPCNDTDFASLVGLSAQEKYKHVYRGVIYSKGPLNLLNKNCRSLEVDGACVANDPANPPNGTLNFSHSPGLFGFGKLGYELIFNYNPDYTASLLLPLQDKPKTGLCNNRFDRVFWHIY